MAALTMILILPVPNAYRSDSCVLTYEPVATRLAEFEYLSVASIESGDLRKGYQQKNAHAHL